MKNFQIHRSNLLTQSRRGGFLQGCLIVLAILLVLAIGVGVFVAMSWRGWAATGMSAVATEVINESDLPESEKPEVIAVFDEVTEAFRAKNITLEELASIFENPEDMPVLSMGMVMQFEGAYVNASGLSDEEKADASLTLNRVSQGLVSKQLSFDDATDILSPVTTTDADGDHQLLMPNQTTDEQIREVITNAKTAVDEAGIPEERVEVDLSEELRKHIEDTLGRKIGDPKP